jgi:hypothetical protein
LRRKLSKLLFKQKKSKTKGESSNTFKGKNITANNYEVPLSGDRKFNTDIKSSRKQIKNAIQSQSKKKLKSFNNQSPNKALNNGFKKRLFQASDMFNEMTSYYNPYYVSKFNPESTGAESDFASDRILATSQANSRNLNFNPRVKNLKMERILSADKPMSPLFKDRDLSNRLRDEVFSSKRM